MQVPKSSHTKLLSKLLSQALRKGDAAALVPFSDLVTQLLSAALISAASVESVSIYLELPNIQVLNRIAASNDIIIMIMMIIIHTYIHTYCYI